MRVKLAVVFALAVAWMAPVAVRELVTPLAVVYVGLVVLCLGGAWLLAHYHHAHRALLAERMLADGWARLPGWAHREVWSCPNCGAMLASLHCARLHTESDTSFCAAFLRLLEERQLAAETAGERPPDGINWAEFTHRNGAGGVDTMTHDAEAIDA